MGPLEKRNQAGSVTSQGRRAASRRGGERSAASARAPAGDG